MTRLPTRWIACFSLFALAGCYGADPVGYSKEEARRIGGRSADGGADLCEEFGWYADGVCDMFCPDADPDCAHCPDPLEPGVQYASTDPDLCEGRPMACEGEFFRNDCGCGCVDPEPPVGCGDVECALYCEYGFETNEEGCAICRCAPAPICPAIACATECEHGYVVDEDGCDTCECAPTPGEACGSRGLAPCAEGEFCLFPESAMCGATDLPGSCQPLPEDCATIYAPVCGCDGETYPNECTAHTSGVSVERVGECDATCGPIMCDLFCGGGFAEGPDGCPLCECAACPPVACTLACEHGFQRGRDGCEICACAPAPGDACGGIRGLGCGEGEFCLYPESAMCGAADQQGTCQSRPEACTREYAPVCGCDGETYSSECEAHARGISVVHDGECEAACVGDSDPSARYIGRSPDECSRIRFSCEPGEAFFSDECGCGCRGGDVCVGESDPSARYVGESPDECSRILFSCEPGEAYFSDECGCGCRGGDAMSCEAMEVRGVGLCEAELGIAWNGEACTSFSGCRCEGEDCPIVYGDVESCRRAYSECLAFRP